MINIGLQQITDIRLKSTDIVSPKILCVCENVFTGEIFALSGLRIKQKISEIVGARRIINHVLTINRIRKRLHVRVHVNNAIVKIGCARQILGNKILLVSLRIFYNSRSNRSIPHYDVPTLERMIFHNDSGKLGICSVLIRDNLVSFFPIRYLPRMTSQSFICA